ncbi:PhoX family phosphatase [Filomicrobium sp.]|uniref:PhoX family protein n=1 Tax=Filomicrobium sp. TaxID=2024831 RepID=UPI00258B8E02|nr:PhoX family phosphatase [Filomicrobium sp.]MCV0368342.1 PhoX family phosphatase [Filomicrobium sp.]
MGEIDPAMTRSQAYEEAENVGRNESANPTLGDVIAQRYSRRDIMRGALAVTAITATVSPLALAAASAARAEGAAPVFDFPEVTAGVDDKHHVANGYDAQILIRWGDPVLSGAPDFDPQKQSADAQAKQFGYNNDYLGYIPLPDAENPSTHGLLVVNHEFSNEELMFPGLPKQDKEAAFGQMTKELVDIEMMAHGGSVLEIRKENGTWSVVPDSKYARRITPETEMTISGPAAGSDRMKTSYDAEGRKVRGMLNNCAGGVTPWGTWLTCEENFNGYFWGDYSDDHPEARNAKRYGVAGRWYNWGQYYDRFDVSKEPNEPNRFGWVVEIDPLDPNSVPKKRTAIGRFKHEGAASVVNKDGRLAIYQGDDQRFDYVYKFVTQGAVNSDDRAANMDLLDAGTLYVARYDADGTGEWLPLVHGEGPLTDTNGFASQADVLIETRRAADLLGATKMDRPEGTDVNPQTQKVYVMLTNNTRRKPEDVNAANPRAKNAFGHIIEMHPDGDDHTSTTFKWEILIKCGDPAIAEIGATFNPATTRDGWLGMPDTVCVDAKGRLWVGTDGQAEDSTGRTDGLYAVETEGALRGTSKLFFRCPVGAELCGPEATPDVETFFVAVQHPGEDGESWKAFGRASTFDDPATRWPDFDPNLPPRPSIVAITKRGGGKIAG